MRAGGPSSWPTQREFLGKACRDYFGCATPMDSTIPHYSKFDGGFLCSAKGLKCYD